MLQTNTKAVRLLCFADLKAIGIRYSREHLWRLERENKFPRRIYLSPQKPVWIEEEILNWLQERMNERADRVYAAHD